MYNRLAILSLAVTAILHAQPGALVFSRGGEAWIMSTDGSNQTQLTTTGGVTITRLSNNVLVFMSGGQLHRATLQGFGLASAPQPIPNTAGAVEFDLNPAGDRIVLTYFAGNNFTLYTMNVDGSGLTAINTTGVHQSGMSWGRDGFIYFVQSAFGNAFSQVLYRIPENGTNNPTQLTNYFSQYPAASGPGNKVAFLYDHPVKRIRTMNADGSSPADVPNATTGDGGYFGVDPFTDLIYYTLGDQIWRIRYDGSGQQLLTSGTFPNFVDYGTLTIDTTAPVVTSVNAAPNPSPVGATINLSASLTDAGGSGLSMAYYTLDGGTPQLMANLSGSAASASINLAPYATAGVHTLCVRGIDMAGNIGQYQCTLLAVYDPNGGFVTGGGWISTALGKANFGLVAKYQGSSTAPNGNLEFHAGTLKFKSTSMAWLVISGTDAILSGFGEVNGAGGYQFEMKVSDLAAGDQAGVKIWNASGTLLDVPPTALGGGQVKIH